MCNRFEFLQTKEMAVNFIFMNSHCPSRTKTLTLILFQLTCFWVQLTYSKEMGMQ